MLTRLMVKNFKSIGEPGIDIELRPLTILVGPNGGGKSSILEALAFLAQNVRHSTAGIELKGPLVGFHEPLAVAYGLDSSKWVSVGVFSTKVDYGVNLSIRPTTGAAMELIITKDRSSLLELVLDGDSQRGYSLVAGYPGGITDMQGNTLTILNGAPLRSLRSWTGYDGILSLDQAAEVVEEIANELAGKAFFVSGLRGEISDGISTGSDAVSVGRKGEHILVVLARVEHPSKAIVKGKIRDWSLAFGLRDLWVGLTAPNVVGGAYVEPVLGFSLNLASASQGTRQVLSMIAQLFTAKPGSIVMIEEPELSLHPEAQDKLPALFADAIKDGKQVMITTHSHYLLLALTEAVKAGLPAEDIAVYEVKKEPETGTTAKRLPVSKEGYIRDWVSSFAEVDQKLLQRRTRRVLAKGSK